ncbi:CLUMA_CG013268, isoform A [Clunio marinus]|uniref:CLUMA_CG013268, isoform A n=1 Tax=Clunio marinus TaxID=568069 RepID=A0A1J1II93_9DIPT|nr:CLUMA_CG013268, isoform A [Clunio marinus]
MKLSRLECTRMDTCNVNIETLEIEKVKNCLRRQKERPNIGFVRRFYVDGTSTKNIHTFMRNNARNLFSSTQGQTELFH